MAIFSVRWFHIFLFSPLVGEDFQLDKHIFQLGWFNHPTNFVCSIFWDFWETRVSLKRWLSAKAEALEQQTMEVQNFVESNKALEKSLSLPVDVKTSSHPFFRGELENTSINYIMAENQWVFLGWFHPYINYGVMGHCFGSVWISFKTLNWNWRNFWDALDKIAISSPNNSEVSGPSLWIHQRLVNDVKAIMP